MVKKPSEKTVLIRKGSRLICSAQIAKTLSELERGLSGLEKIGNKEGLLLIFPLEGRWMNGIWMAGMKFPLDIVFIGKDKRITGIKRNIQPITFNPRTWKLYVPEKKSKYCLELNAGCAKGLKEGDKLEFQG